MADIEKVIKDLEQLKKCCHGDCNKTCKYFDETDSICFCHYELSSDSTIDEAIRTIRGLENKSDDVCKWTLIDEELNVYDTDCREPWFLENGTPEGNKMNYCPSCGRKIKVVE